MTKIVRPIWNLAIIMISHLKSSPKYAVLAIPNPEHMILKINIMVARTLLSIFLDVLLT